MLGTQALVTGSLLVSLRWPQQFINAEQCVCTKTKLKGQWKSLESDPRTSFLSERWKESARTREMETAVREHMWEGCVNRDTLRREEHASLHYLRLPCMPVSHQPLMVGGNLCLRFCSFKYLSSICIFLCYLPEAGGASMKSSQVCILLSRQM